VECASSCSRGQCGSTRLSGYDGFVVLAHAGLRSKPLSTARRALRRHACAAASALVAALGGCAIGPDYLPEAAPVSKTFKELKGWKVATPSDSLPRGDWWAFYKDANLNFLIKQVEISNQTVAAQAAAYEEARALIREAQAALFPTLSASYTATRSHIGVAASGGTENTTSPTTVAGQAGITTSTFVPGVTGSWDLDVWGKVRRQIESNASAAQVSAADLDNVKLVAQAQLATAYFNLRAADALQALLLRTVQEYKKTLEIVRNQFKAGYSVSEADVATAEAQVFNTQSLAINVGVQRAQYEHAIAMLVGRPPAELTMAQRPLSGAIPKLPVSVPSALLERRPDIAAAERTMQEQNALIGVQMAAYFPDVSLSAVLQWSGSRPLPFNVANEIWSLSGAATQILFDGGLRGAEIDAARAVYWQSVANYRQTVLSAFQGVEDELAAIRILTQQLAVQRKAVNSEREAVRVYLAQFQGGTVAFTTVVTAQIQLLSYEESELTIRQNLFLASVALIQDLGGGWDVNLLPTKKELESDFSILPQLPPNRAGLRFESSEKSPSL
jgi:NodT family efflux transporter outer membrane factor (OMF) lipoprotein